MATKRTVRRNVRNTKTGANAMNIQRAINSDLEVLLRDYKKLGLELWQLPVTKFIVGGAALGALVPVLMKVFKDYDAEAIRGKIEEFVHMAKDEVSNLRE